MIEDDQAMIHDDQWPDDRLVSTWTGSEMTPGHQQVNRQPSLDCGYCDQCQAFGSRDTTDRYKIK